MNNIKILASLKELESIKTEWNLLLESNTNRTPYQRWLWNYSWVKSSDQESTLHVLAIYDDNGALIGIAPLRQAFSIGPVKVLSFIGQEASNYLDFIVKEDSSSQIFIDMMNYLVANRENLCLDLKIAEPSISVSCITNVLAQAGWCGIEAAPYTKRLIVDLGADYETYLSGLSSKMRQEIRAEVKKLSKISNIEFTCSGQATDFEQEMDVLFHLNSLKWGGDSKTSHQNHRACYRACFSEGVLKIFILWCDGMPVGALSAYTQNSTLFAEVAGFDYSVAKVDLGKVFYHYLFSWASANGYNKVDLSSGEEPYKFRYKPQELSKWRITAYRTTSARNIVVGYRWLSDKIYLLKSRLVKTWLFQSTGLYSLYRMLKDRKLPA